MSGWRIITAGYLLVQRLGAGAHLSWRMHHAGKEAAVALGAERRQRQSRDDEE